MIFFEHHPHPHVADRTESGPVKVATQARQHTAYARFNSRLGLKITGGVGSMTCAWFFTAIALVSLPSAIESHNVITIVSWVAQTFLQLTLLSVILFGQGLQAQAADGRADATWKDAEAILHGLEQAQLHLDAQDAHLLGQDDKLAALIDQVSAAVIRLEPAIPVMPADWWPRLWPNLAAWVIVTVPAWIWHHRTLLRALDDRADERHGLLLSQLAADRDLAEQHREATHQLADSVTDLHRRLDAAPTDPLESP